MSEAMSEQMSEQMNDQVAVVKALEMKKIFEERMALIHKVNAHTEKIVTIKDMATQANSDFKKVKSMIDELSELVAIIKK